MKKVIMMTSRKYQFGDEHKEKVKGISMTVPNESYTIKDLLVKYASGIMPAVMKNPFFDEDPDFYNFDETRRVDFDLADVTEIMEEIERNAEHKRYLEDQLKKVDYLKETGQTKSDLKENSQTNTDGVEGTGTEEV